MKRNAWSLFATAALIAIPISATAKPASPDLGQTDLGWDGTFAAHVVTTGYDKAFNLADLKNGQTITLTTTVDRQQSVWSANGSNFDRFGLYPVVDGALKRLAGAPVFETQTNNGAVGNPVCVSGYFEATGFLGADATCANPKDAAGQTATRAGGTLKYTVTVAKDGSWTGSVTPLDADGQAVTAFVGSAPSWTFSGQLPDATADYAPYLRVYGGTGTMTLTVTDSDLSVSAPGNGNGHAHGWYKKH